MKTAASSCGYSIPDESSEFPSCGEPRILALKQRPTGAKVGVSARVVGEICRFKRIRNLKRMQSVATVRAICLILNIVGQGAN